MTSLLILATAVYVAINLLIGFWNLRDNTFHSFISAKNSFHWFWICASIVGSVVGGGMFFAVVQMASEAGLVVLCLPAAYILGYWLLILALPIVRRLLDKTEGLSLFDLVSTRLQGQPFAPAALLSLSLVFFGMYFFILAGQFTVLARFYQAMFGISPSLSWALSLGVIGLSTLIYSIIGGIKKDIVSDLVQVALSFLGIGIVGCYLISVPLSHIVRVPPTPAAASAYGPGFLFGILLFFSPSFLARFDYWQRIVACRSDADAKRALLWSLPPILLAYLVLGTLGMYVRGAAAGPLSADPTIWGLAHLLPEQVFILVALALYAAVMSAADTMLNVTSVSAHTIIRTLLPRAQNGRISTLRCLSFAIGMLASLVVITAPDLVDLFVGAFSSIVIASPAIAVLVFGARPRALPVLLSILLGYGTFLILFLGFPGLRKTAFVIGAAVALIPPAASFFARPAPEQERTVRSIERTAPLRRE